MLLAFALFLALFAVIGEPPEPLFPVIMGGVGTLLGVGQQRVLRRLLGRVTGWAVATGVGFGLGITLALIIGEGDGLLARVLAGAVHGLGVGVILGTLQYFVLKPHLADARRWIPASMGAWMVGAVAADITGYFVDGLDILVGPVAAAAVSGVAVVRLLVGEVATDDRSPQAAPARLRTWIPANLAGYGLGGALFGAVQASRLRHHFEVTTSAAEAVRLLAVTTSMSLILFGALVGTGQWLALRRHLRAGWWMPATCLGWAVAGVIVGTVSGVAFGTVSTIGPRLGVAGTVGAAVTNCIVVGLLPASAQWLILRRQVSAGSRPADTRTGEPGGRYDGRNPGARVRRWNG